MREIVAKKLRDEMEHRKKIVGTLFLAYRESHDLDEALKSAGMSADEIKAMTDEDAVFETEAIFDKKVDFFDSSFGANAKHLNEALNKMLKDSRELYHDFKCFEADLKKL